MLEWLQQLSIAKWFLAMALIFGSINIFVTPPFQAPDETNHFHRSVDLARGHLMGQHEGGDRLGGYLHSEYLMCTRYYDLLRKKGKSFERKYEERRNPSLEEDIIFVDYANVGYYAPTVHLPQAIGIFVVTWISDSVLSHLYAGRISGFLFWLIVVYLAIKIVPVHKSLMAFLALLPASISINSALSGDTVSNALIFLWVAIMFKYMLTVAKVTMNQWRLLLLIAMVITINKLVYTPIILMLFLIPTKNFEKKWMPWIMIASCALIGLLWSYYSSGLFIPYDNYDEAFRDGQQLNPGVAPFEQLGYVLSHPFWFTKIAILSYVESGFATWAHYIGKFGWEKHYIPTWGVGLLSLALIGQLLDREKTPFSKKQLLWMLAIVTLMTMAFTAVIYMQWSPVGNDRVRSLSGRYFIPIGLLFFMAVKGLLPKGFLPNWKIPNSNILGINVIGLIMLIWSVWKSFY